jgi:hypothetical protein
MIVDKRTMKNNLEYIDEKIVSVDRCFSCTVVYFSVLLFLSRYLIESDRVRRVDDLPITFFHVPDSASIHSQIDWNKSIPMSTNEKQTYPIVHSTTTTTTYVISFWNFSRSCRSSCSLSASNRVRNCSRESRLSSSICNFSSSIDLNYRRWTINHHD